ncbi:MAG: tRNA (adenosine(37)-N6)-threonylcarbamoyltransferase complex dimerization subunit type 1 TsaB [Clostridiales bacterium]|nr:tRNA (adenosine(37)-N6)-threonylcarbamoyltransferase complex dimerization subunit type 1 TsaB [Clostridiales bacterium]
MNYLFIDTAEGTRALLFAGGKYFYDENMKTAGSEILLPMIDGLLSRAGVSLADVDIFGACVGPGSFTGLRIGLTTIKTFCYATGKPCFAVNNLRLNSYNNERGKVISIADAGNRVCYIARYDGEREVEEARCVTLDDAKKIVAEHPDHAVSTDVKLAPIFAGASGVGERELKIAAERHIKNKIEQVELLPLYIRKPQPERGAGDL